LNILAVFSFVRGILDFFKIFPKESLWGIRVLSNNFCGGEGNATKFNGKRKAAKITPLL
jgi:hypothetical protein